MKRRNEAGVTNVTNADQMTSTKTTPKTPKVRKINHKTSRRQTNKHTRPNALLLNKPETCPMLICSKRLGKTRVLKKWVTTGRKLAVRKQKNSYDIAQVKGCMQETVIEIRDLDEVATARGCD